ncbi:MAG: hypothetical protein D6732_01820 [Methanobacteriota archaeon]|nr:MAG: hypothetical protein D6732_01820 [Euryarchaeota archaeon]
MILLNINREQPSNFDALISEAHEIILNIDSLSRTIDLSDPNTPKLMVLKNRIKDLMELVSNIGDYQDVQASIKQDKIMDIQNNLLILTNRIFGISQEIDMMLSIITNFLLYHLCSTAAATPHSQVIGVANVLAQVLSSEQSNKEPLLELNQNLPPSMFFNRFALNFNYLLTNAGLYASPITSLPHISISALGGWAETALNSFSELFEFIDKYFSITDFLSFDKIFDSVVQFDSAKDVLSVYLYANEFYSSLAALADLLSGIRFPKNLLGLEEDVVFSSNDQITTTLARAIEKNHERIQEFMKTIYTLFDNGLIDKNENPYKDPELQQIEMESNVWILIAKMGLVIQKLLSIESQVFTDTSDSNLEHRILSSNLVRDAVKQQMPTLERDLITQFDELETQFLTLMGFESPDQILASSSRFIRYRHFFQYLMYLASALYIFFENDEIISRLNKEYYFLFKPPNSEKNPIGTIILGQVFCIMGLEKQNDFLIQEGIEILTQILPAIQFQSHHYIHVMILIELFNAHLQSLSHMEIAETIKSRISELLEGNVLMQESKLYQKLIVYTGLLDIYKESGIFMSNSGERLIPFDIFTWLMTPALLFTLPFIPLNTALDNLDEG